LKLEHNLFGEEQGVVEGHFVILLTQLPSAQRVDELGQDGVGVQPPSNALIAEQFPSAQRKGVATGHPFKLTHFVGSVTQEPSAHLYVPVAA
jgi:hypothetical protein